jgi:predicted CDP-diglyceride synthetase/phosphatidate cytidylyltransferase
MLFFSDVPFEFYWTLMVEYYTWFTRLLNLYTFLYLVKNSPPFTKRQEGIHFLKSFAKPRCTVT